MATYLSPDLLRYGAPNSLVIEAYPRYETWELDLPWLGRSDDVAWAVFWRNLVGINLVQATFVVSVIMSLYVLALFFLDPDRKPGYLWFSLLCVAFCAAYLNVTVHNEAIPELPLEALSKACMVLSSTFLLVFILEYAGPFRSRRAKAVVFGALILAASAAALVILTRTTKRDILAAFGPAMNLVILPELLCEIACVSWAFFVRRNRLVAPLFVAISVVLVTAGHDIVFLNSSRLPYAWLTPYGYFAYILAIFAMLVMDQARLYRLSLGQAADLRAGQARIEKLNREITRQRDSFLRFVPTQFLQLLGKESTLDIRLGDSSLRFLSVLYSDMRRYTGVSGSTLPEQTLRFLNGYLQRMEGAIQDHNGFVDKYIGDAILALFPYEGEPVGELKSLSADLAVQAASEMNELLEELNAALRSRGEREMDIGIGIDTGEVVLGTVGTESRLDTTVVGETVNVAARLEGLATRYHTRVLVSGVTRAAMVYPERFDFRLVDRVSVAGRREGMELYELLDGDGETVRRKLASRERMDEARRSYDQGRFAEAAALFAALAAEDPGDPLPRLFAERCAAYEASPPPAGWNGVYHHVDP